MKRPSARRRRALSRLAQPQEMILPAHKSQPPARFFMPQEHLTSQMPWVGRRGSTTNSMTRNLPNCLPRKSLSLGTACLSPLIQIAGIDEQLLGAAIEIANGSF
jgi:hypothetical protein